MNIGILQSAGIAGEIIGRVLAVQETKDLFTATIYSKENQNDKNVGADLRAGNIDAIVVAPGSNTEFNFEGSMLVRLAGSMRIAVAVPGEDVSDVYVKLTKEHLTLCVQKLWQMLRRDFLLSSPRIAVLALNATINEREKDIIIPVVEEQTEQGVGVFGPYLADEFFAESKQQHFDAVLTITDQQAQQLLGTVNDCERTRFLAGIPMVMTQSDFPADYVFEENMEDAEQALRRAAYIAKDIAKNRRAYDVAHTNPLPKLYHERRDDSEKVRFSIPKKKEAE